MERNHLILVHMNSLVAYWLLLLPLLLVIAANEINKSFD